MELPKINLPKIIVKFLLLQIIIIVAFLLFSNTNISLAAIAEPCKICSGGECITQASPPYCYHDFDECSTNADCASCSCSSWSNIPNSCGKTIYCFCNDNESCQVCENCSSTFRCVPNSSCSAPPDPTGTPPPPISPPPPTGPPPPPAPDIDPFPEPPVPCSDVRYPEFHSLRPYQASPCYPIADELALYCGNDLVLTDQLEVEKVFTYTNVPEPPVIWYIYDGDFILPTCFTDADCSPGSVCTSGMGINYCAPANQRCRDNGDGTETCIFAIERERQIAVDLSGSYLPIMGNTELVTNYQGNPDQLNDAQKVNEYVSWYLHGVVGRAEYDPPDPETEAGKKKIIDYSGPIRKLFSWASQAKEWILQIERANDAVQGGALRRYSRHDQIIACTRNGRRVRCY